VAVTSDSDDTLLGQLLLDAGVIDESQLQAALEAHRASGSPLGSSLVKLGLATQHDIEEILRAKAKRELADAESWGDAESSFTSADAPTGTLVPIAVDVLAILAELHRENATDLIDPSERDTSEQPAPEVAEPSDEAEEVEEEPEEVEALEEAEPAEIEDEPLPFIGRANGRARTYHALNCRSARSIPRKQRVYFSSPSEAESQQYKACNRCTPGED
jgi:hypothetical protein